MTRSGPRPPRPPPSAVEVLEHGVLCYLAVVTPAGPHLTPTVHALDGGRLWVTTSRSSVKARAWRRDPSVSGLIRSAGAAVTFRGRVRTYDALDPLSWPAAAAAGPRLVRAAAAFSLKNARFFAGYAVDAARVPLAWTPPGRVFVRIEVLAGRVLWPGAFGVGEEWGEWVSPRRAEVARVFGPLPRSRGLDFRAPLAVRRAMGQAGDGVVAMDVGGALTVLPVRWRRVPAEGAYEAAVPRAYLDPSEVGPGWDGVLTIDRASSWRAADMTGLMMRGPMEAFVPAQVRRGVRVLRERLAILGGGVVEDTVLLRLRPSTVVWWQGWDSGTVSRRVRPRPQRADRARSRRRDVGRR